MLPFCSWAALPCGQVQVRTSSSHCRRSTCSCRLSRSYRSRRVLAVSVKRVVSFWGGAQVSPRGRAVCSCSTSVPREHPASSYRLPQPFTVSQGQGQGSFYLSPSRLHCLGTRRRAPRRRPGSRGRLRWWVRQRPSSCCSLGPVARGLMYRTGEISSPRQCPCCIPRLYPTRTVCARRGQAHPLLRCR